MADPGRRLIVLVVVLGLALGGVVTRLVFVQTLAADRAVVFGVNQRLQSVELASRRGAILDRHGAELAISVPKQTVWADPRSVRDPVAAGRQLAPVLGLDEQALRDQLSSSAGFVYLARKVDGKVATQVKEMGIAGVSLLEESGRLMPSGDLAASVVGNVGIDDQGLSGLELQYHGQLTGEAGQLLVERGPDGREIASGTHRLDPAAPGNDLVLTIDRTLQYAAEDLLSQQIKATNAKGGIVVVMDPVSGEILAMVNLVVPRRGQPAVPAPDNMAVTRVYEPGSVNKVITVAVALEEGSVGPQQVLNVPDTLTVADGTFKDVEPHPTRSWTIGEVLTNSSNVGSILVGQRVGKANLDRYLRAFGLGTPTGLGFPGESAGLLPDVNQWSGTSIATLPIGQGIAVTAVQMLGVFNTIANDGVYVAPTLVREVVDEDGTVRPTPRPEPRRIVSEDTARRVQAMLAGVVTEGTGTAAAVEGYSVGGKTGTARKPLDGARGYKEGAYVASFAGFLPVEAPRLSAIVILDEPTPIFGGVVSAPVFSQLAAQGARLLEVPPGLPTTLTPAPGPGR